ncbi:MAG: PepSY domain-containing protein [Oscillospiraceae bacterium]|nr:PepSY domain-containing protein [Oscillospiraceae bacterium]
MKRRIIALIALTALALSLFSACGKKEKPDHITAEEAQKIAFEAAGVSKKEKHEIHTHVEEFEGKPCFTVHIVLMESEYAVIVDAMTGEVLSVALDD